MLVAAFIILSAFLNGLMIVLKAYFDEDELFKKLKPIIPPLIGGVIAIAAALVEFGTGLELVMAFPLGFLAGTFSTTNYEIFEKFLKSKAEEL